MDKLPSLFPAVKIHFVEPNPYNPWPHIETRWVKLNPDGTPEKGQGLSGEENDCTDHRI
jgi:hypothetical protein|uniref:Uncharacterized protein n=1 Tax=Myoviridae sp. ctshb19 TaxID=2825194 RepID=A0A8S5UGH1_9CAUD|nr:MAG TPA: hypothetical protein [Myoviridae sp. ctshb19]